MLSTSLRSLGLSKDPKDTQRQPMCFPDAPSDICGVGSLHCEYIQLMPSFHGHGHRDTMFVLLDKSKAGMDGTEIRDILLVFSFYYCEKHFSCVLINWFLHEGPTVIPACGLCSWSVTNGDSPLSKSLTLIQFPEEHTSCLCSVLQFFTDAWSPQCIRQLQVFFC